eukprot:Trichotokara_eunicae@DN4362_c0_g1_i1.p1
MRLGMLRLGGIYKITFKQKLPKGFYEIDWDNYESSDGLILKEATEDDIRFCVSSDGESDGADDEDSMSTNIYLTLNLTVTSPGHISLTTDLPLKNKKKLPLKFVANVLGLSMGKPMLKHFVREIGRTSSGIDTDEDSDFGGRSRSSHTLY